MFDQFSIPEKWPSLFPDPFPIETTFPFHLVTCTETQDNHKQPLSIRERRPPTNKMKRFANIETIPSSNGCDTLKIGRSPIRYQVSRKTFRTNDSIYHQKLFAILIAMQFSLLSLHTIRLICLQDSAHRIYDSRSNPTHFSIHLLVNDTEFKIRQHCKRPLTITMTPKASIYFFIRVR